MTIDTYTAWRLARLAGCCDPDAADSPGALFLDSVQSAYNDAVDEGCYGEDSPQEIADSAVPAYTHELWKVFVDLGAYTKRTYPELGATTDDLTQCAAVALYMIAERLVNALHEARDEDDEDDSA